MSTHTRKHTMHSRRLIYKGEAVPGLESLSVSFDSKTVKINGTGVILTYYKYPMPIQLKLQTGDLIRYEFDLEVDQKDFVISYDMGTKEPIINVIRS